LFGGDGFDHRAPGGQVVVPGVEGGDFDVCGSCMQRTYCRGNELSSISGSDGDQRFELGQRVLDFRPFAAMASSNCSGVRVSPAFRSGGFTALRS
jgi:hypothetical protein